MAQVELKSIYCELHASTYLTQRSDHIDKDVQLLITLQHFPARESFLRPQT